MSNIVRTNGQDFSALRPIILINPSGYSIANPTVQIVDTNNGQDFSMVDQLILVNTSGTSIN